MEPPYLDIHGEADLGLRKGRPLFLHRQRYEELRKMWLSHGVPSYIGMLNFCFFNLNRKKNGTSN